jgi:hypothetical protein
MEFRDDDHDEILQQFLANQFKGSSVNSGQRICNSLRSCDFLPHTGAAPSQPEAALENTPVIQGSQESFVLTGAAELLSIPWRNAKLDRIS